VWLLLLSSETSGLVLLLVELGHVLIRLNLITRVLACRQLVLVLHDQEVTQSFPLLFSLESSTNLDLSLVAW
jgi:hypothetical protein